MSVSPFRSPSSINVLVEPKQQAESTTNSVARQVAFLSSCVTVATYRARAGGCNPFLLSPMLPNSKELVRVTEIDSTSMFFADKASSMPCARAAATGIQPDSPHP